MKANHSARLEYLESLAIELRSLAAKKGYGTISEAIEAAPARTSRC